MAITNKEICERLECIEAKMPNGELKEMHENIKEIKGILLDISASSASVVITEKYGPDSEDSFYLGKRLIAPTTEVEKL